MIKIRLASFLLSVTGLLLSSTGLLFSASQAALAQDANNSDIDARAIAQSMFDRDDGKTQISRQVLSTCQYKIAKVKGKKKRQCVEKPRVKTMESVRKDYGAKGKDVKAISILLSPPSERGISFLQYDYEQQDKDADQWIYLSALGKAKRIVSGNDDEPKTGSFFGSELNYEDMEAPHIDNYTYKIIKSVSYQGRDCWVMEIKPTPQQARKSQYSKTINWVDKERLIQLKTIAYDRQGKKIKRINARMVKQIDGIWIPQLLTVDNLQTKRISHLNIQAIAINKNINDDFLTLRTLTDSAYREQNLNRYRSELK